MAKIYESFLSTIIPQGKNWVSFDPRNQTLSGEDSTWMVDRLEIPRVVDFFFFFLIRPLNCFGCFKTLALFCQGSVKIKLSLLSVHCYTTIMLSSKQECLACFPQCLLRTFQRRESKLKRKKIL